MVPLDTFLERLASSKLLPDEEMSGLRDRLNSREGVSSARDVAQILVDDQRLTEFQAKTLLQGSDARLRVGNYVILDELGRGGMGQVYRAKHLRMRREVALKILPADSLSAPDALQRFEREVEAAAKLAHPNIVTAHDADEADGAPFLVMELIVGRDLATIVRKDGPLPVEEAVGYVVQAARGLAFAHSQGVIHRDVKPSNLLVNGTGQLKVSDFGLARLQSAGQNAFTITRDQITNTSTVLGTADFLAPEQARNIKEADHRADIYGLGCTLFYLLTGQPVYPGKSLMQKVAAHQESPIPSLTAVREEIPAELDLVFQRMVAKQPKQRLRSMESVIQALLPFAQTADTAVNKNDATIPAIPISPAARRLRRPSYFVAGAVAAAMILLFAWSTVDYIDIGSTSARPIGELPSNSPAQPTDANPNDSMASAARPPPEIRPINNQSTPDFLRTNSSRIIQVGPNSGMVATLESALEAAQDGDTIEIHTNEPLMVTPGRIAWQKGALTIRAATGYSPIIARVDGIPGVLLRFVSYAPGRRIILDGLAIVNMSATPPEAHIGIHSDDSLTIQNCLYITYSGGISCRNESGMDVRIVNSYIAAYWPDKSFWPTVNTLEGRLVLDNNLFAGASSISFARSSRTTELEFHRNTLVHMGGIAMNGVGRLKSSKNLFAYVAKMMGSRAETVATFESFRDHLQYWGDRNLFFKTPYTVSWWSGDPKRYTQRSAVDLSDWNELTKGNEQDPLLGDPLFEHPEMIRLSKEQLLPPQAFSLKEESPARELGIGADLSKIPPLPPQLHQVVPSNIYNPTQFQAH